MNSTHTIKQYIIPPGYFLDGPERFITMNLVPNQDGTPTLKLETDGELELSIDELDEHIDNCKAMLDRLMQRN